MNIDIRVDKDMFDGNVFGLLNLSRIVMPHFLQKKRGQIAVTSSVCGKVGGRVTNLIKSLVYYCLINLLIGISTVQCFI
jgi:NADP-dependent 3-hydroxy acid dehydrogenase YdfG